MDKTYTNNEKNSNNFHRILCSFKNTYNISGIFFYSFLFVERYFYLSTYVAKCISQAVTALARYVFFVYKHHCQFRIFLRKCKILSKCITRTPILIPFTPDYFYDKNLPLQIFFLNSSLKLDMNHYIFFKKIINTT